MDRISPEDSRAGPRDHQLQPTCHYFRQGLIAGAKESLKRAGKKCAKKVEKLF